MSSEDRLLFLFVVVLLSAFSAILWLMDPQDPQILLVYCLLVMYIPILNRN